MLTYKGYRATTWDEDGESHLLVVNSCDSLHTIRLPGQTAEQALVELIDDYLETCTDLGHPPSQK